MKATDLHTCDRRYVIYKDNHNWCLAEHPENCPLSHRVNDAEFECMYPDHFGYSWNKPSTSPS